MDLFHISQLGTQAAVHTKDLFVDNRHNRQAIKAVGKGLPLFNIVTSFALVVKTVDTVNGAAFVVAS